MRKGVEKVSFYKHKDNHLIIAWQATILCWCNLYMCQVSSFTIPCYELDKQIFVAFFYLFCTVVGFLFVREERDQLKNSSDKYEKLISILWHHLEVKSQQLWAITLISVDLCLNGNIQHTYQTVK